MGQYGRPSQQQLGLLYVYIREMSQSNELLMGVKKTIFENIDTVHAMG